MCVCIRDSNWGTTVRCMHVKYIYTYYRMVIDVQPFDACMWIICIYIYLKCTHRTVYTCIHILGMIIEVQPCDVCMSNIYIYVLMKNIFTTPEHSTSQNKNMLRRQIDNYYVIQVPEKDVYCTKSLWHPNHKW